VILHSDLNNFYASVECILNPELKGRCIAVCGSEEDRHGIVLAKSEEAKKFGVKTAETIWQARAKCPDLEIVSPHFSEYHMYSVLVRQIYKKYTDQIEPFGLDECWLDVTGSRLLFGTGREIADKIREDVKRETGLTVSVGVSFNKVFAKLGSDLKKPDATTEISIENFKEKVWHLPADSIIGVGKATFKKLGEFGIRTLGEVANTPKDFLTSHFGKSGITLWEYANGIDNSPVTHQDFKHDVKSVGHGSTLKKDLTSGDEVWPVIFSLARQIEASLRQKRLKALTCSISVKTTDLGVKEYQTPLKNPSQSAYEIATELFELFNKKHSWDKNVRAITVRAVKLAPEDEAAEQISFFEENVSNPKREKAEKTAFELEERFGKGAVTFASIMKNDNMPKAESEE